MSQVQFDVRMASDYISYEMRNVTSISTTFSATDMIDVDFLKLKYPLVDSVNFEIQKQEDRYFLDFTVEGEDLNSENEYILKTKVLLNNVTNATLAMGNEIYYEKP